MPSQSQVKRQIAGSAIVGSVIGDSELSGDPSSEDIDDVDFEWTLEEDVRRMYDTAADWSRAYDITRDTPEKLGSKWMNADLAGRPLVMTERLKENAVIDTKNVTRFWCFQVTAKSTLSAGAHEARIEFVYDVVDIGKGADITLRLDGASVDEGRVGRMNSTLRSPRRETLHFSIDEAKGIACDIGEAVLIDRGPCDDSFGENAKLANVEIDASASRTRSMRAGLAGSFVCSRGDEDRESRIDACEAPNR